MPRILTTTIALAAAALLALAPPALAAKKKPAHALRVSASSTKAVTPGKLTTVTVRVVNSGRSTARRVRVSVRGGKGLSVSTKRPKVASTIKSGKSSRARVKVRLRGNGPVSLRFAASASSTKTARKAIAVSKQTNGIEGRYFWRTILIGSTAYYEGFYFSNDKWAYRGIPEGGLPNCTARTAPDGEKDGCVPYTYNSKTKALVVDGKAGTLEKVHQIAVDGNSFAEASVPAPGTRLQATGQFINAYGFPPYSTYVTAGIELRTDGQFAKSSAISGSQPGTDFTAIPPDSRGTYVIGGAGIIQFNYADGKVTRDTIGILFNKAEQPDPNYGLLLDDSVFFGPNSDVN